MRTHAVRYPVGEGKQMIRLKITVALCIWILFSFIAVAGGETSRTKVKATNPLNESRTNETVSIDLKASPALLRYSRGRKPSVYSEHSKQFILYQTIDNNGDGKNDELALLIEKPLIIEVLSE